MKKQFLFFIALFIAFAGFSGSKYTIDDSRVEQLMETSTPVSLEMAGVDMFNVTKIQQDQNVWIAVALDFFLGGLGIHRVYLGTPAGIIAGYFFTCGGIFGILPLIDLIVLVINNDDISPYIGKKGLIMFN